MSLVENLRFVSPEVFACEAADLLDTLETENNQACTKCAAKLSQLNTQLKQATTDRAKAVAQQQSTLQDKKAHDQRLNAHEASIRMHEGLISGDHKRCIPLYSQIDGLISVAENDLGAAQRRRSDSERALTHLREALASTKDAQRKTQASIEKLNNELGKLQHEIEQLDRKTSSTGKQLTKLHGVREAVLTLRAKYGLAALRVALVANIKKEFFTAMCLEDLQRLVQQHTAALQLV
ncbi:hypothetical protein SDRG_09688 [Saprolegnia diclina VS20]|uniref:Uncharacterized protein n=1 Tax=Saprolegnia diclina (strain VS20) TaxID=1156394 RepID=T0QGF6_SAPDV|nr:hypothetical protein SDRG_09688 [Saprolegnia diclina VS20]EQC32715.1 hypothetical protein SDRG_09688 [Saprolegnia diclina VS20]|eukprot:XP_008613859.1 hypothetical protein SDRG_09688 [Saprolegnia diclina VS20]